MKAKLLISLVISILVVMLSANLMGQKSVEAKKDIVDTAVASNSFPTLVAAVQAAGLVDALKSKGPFTVFAPSEEAFSKLEKANPGILAELLKPENKEKLASILKYHVVSGKIIARDVMKLQNNSKVKTLQGQSIVIKNKSGVYVNNAKVIKTDIEATNGVIHVIDTVILPK